MRYAVFVPVESTMRIEVEAQDRDAAIDAAFDAVELMPDVEADSWFEANRVGIRAEIIAE